MVGSHDGGGDGSDVGGSDGKDDGAPDGCGEGPWVDGCAEGRWVGLAVGESAGTGEGVEMRAGSDGAAETKDSMPLSDNWSTALALNTTNGE